jgi:hypothetical protein
MRSGTVAVLVAVLALSALGGCVVAEPSGTGGQKSRGEAPVPTATAPVVPGPTAVATPVPTAEPALPAAPPTPAPVPPSAAPWTPPPREPTVQIELPDLVGQDLDDVVAALEALGADDLRLVDATGQGRRQVVDSNWQVCTQDPREGRTVDVDDRITLAVVKQSERCP